MVAISVAVIPVYVGQALASDSTGWQDYLLRGLRYGLHAAMAADVLVRTYLAPRRLQFLSRHKLDVAAIAIPPLRGLREVVALRSVLRRPGFIRFGFFAAAIVCSCAVVVYRTERNQPDASIDSYGDAFWWALATVTTVGYGDVAPVTGQGRLAAVILMVLGVAMFSVLTAHIAAYFLDDAATRHPSQLSDRLGRIESAILALGHDLTNEETDESEARYGATPIRQDMP